jgi:hypothetical protein
MVRQTGSNDATSGLLESLPHSPDALSAAIGTTPLAGDISDIVLMGNGGR